jgi:hypothetical protein
MNWTKERKTRKMKLRKLMVLFAVAALMLTAFSAVAFAGGNRPKHLGERGWTCVDPDGPGVLTVHCFPPAVDLFAIIMGQESPASIQAKVFDTLDPAAEDAGFFGTEILIRGDLYGGQPCPQSGENEYDVVPLGGTDYRACHHYEH